MTEHDQTAIPAIPTGTVPVANEDFSLDVELPVLGDPVSEEDYLLHSGLGGVDDADRVDITAVIADAGVMTV
jgi:hypothetical protein